MTTDRERAVIDAFVSVANSLVDSFDIVELLNGLTFDCAALLDVASAGLLLADRRGVLHVMVASSEATRDLELFQLQRDEGPCLDCFRLGSAVSVADLEADAGRWPQFVPAARAAGIASVHAIPLRLGDTILGTLGLFGARTGALCEEDLALAQALAHVASVAIVAGNLLNDKDAVVRQLQSALETRVVIEQAKGLLAEQGGLDMDEAFNRLRGYARGHNQRVSEVARQLISRSLPGDRVLTARTPARTPPHR